MLCYIFFHAVFAVVLGHVSVQDPVPVPRDGGRRHGGGGAARGEPGPAVCRGGLLQQGRPESQVGTSSDP